MEKEPCGIRAACGAQGACGLFLKAPCVLWREPPPSTAHQADLGQASGGRPPPLVLSWAQTCFQPGQASMTNKPTVVLIEVHALL